MSNKNEKIEKTDSVLNAVSDATTEATASKKDEANPTLDLQKIIEDALAKQAQMFEQKISTIEKAYADKFSPDAGNQIDAFVPTAIVYTINGKLMTDIKMSKDFVEIRESGVQVHVQECVATLYDGTTNEASELNLPLREYLGVRDKLTAEIKEVTKTGYDLIVPGFGNVSVNKTAIN